MAAVIDYSRLRNQTLDSSQDEEAVTVNTRALIDKVLARYSGEWTTFRELIQNAADASATRVSIKFETLPSPTVPTPQSTDPSEQLKHVILNHTIRRVVVTNNGQPFDENDWSRLKRIAEGNPDETKIGAFGVGFYSVFADCENPFVTSGKQTMAFYWKGNSLFTRRGTLPADHPSSDTSFVLDYRNTTAALPNLISICHFLSTSLTFVGLQNIDLSLDDWDVFSLSKKSAPSTAVPIPSDLNTKTKQGMMKITGIDCQNAQIDASWMNIVGWTPTAERPASIAPEPDKPSLRSFFSRLAGGNNSVAAKRAAKEEAVAQKAIFEDLMGRSSATVFIRVNTVQIKTQVASSFAAELERATKKPPPKQTRIAILTSSFDETSASMSTLTGTAAQKASEIITSVLPNRNGRIFIGFPTAQTTGLLAHISAPSLIPTVERESIDLNARWVRDWNAELLTTAGIACRIAYAGEMATLRSKLAAATQRLQQNPDAKKDDDTRYQSAVESLYPAAVHTLKQYTFGESTPLARTGQIIGESFWTCGKKTSIDLFSSRGVLPSHQVRIASENLSFVHGIPVVPEVLRKDAEDFINQLQDTGMISDITTSDIISELERQALSESQLAEFLKWAAKKVRDNELDVKAIKSMLDVTIANLDAEPNGKGQVLVLAQIKTFLNSSRIGPENPVPEHTVPFRISKDVRHIDMQGFGWEELQLVPWLRWLLDKTGGKSLSKDYDLEQSADFAGQVLTVVSKNWENVSQSSKSTIVEMLAVRSVIPTRTGMKRPAEAYFSSVKLFDDLPTVVGLQNVKDKVLKAIGVRKTIELHVIFERLMVHAGADGNATGTGWSHVDLIKYLVSVWNDIPSEDIAQLKSMPICPAEKQDDPRQATAQRYRIAELFEPNDALRSLGFNVLQWPGPLNLYNAEGKFVRALGLRSAPSVPEIIDVLVRALEKRDNKLYEAALQYFVEKHYTNNYASFDLSSMQIPFLPLENSAPFQVSRPSDCFTDPKAEVLSFQILRKDLQAHGAKFGVRPDPRIEDCAARLLKRPPHTRAEARRLFGYFAGRSNDIGTAIAERLSSAPIVPLLERGKEKQSDEASSIRFVSPGACFLGDGQEYGDIFDYVDFGDEANLFLLKVGCKHEPSNSEIARLVLSDPTRIFQTIGPDRYRGLLRRLHVNISSLKRDKILWRDMKTAPFLLCYKEKSASKEAKQVEKLDAEADFEPTVLSWRLMSADKIVVQDDLISYTLFRDHLVVAPQEDTLEEFYLALGSSTVSSLVEAEPRLGPRIGNQKEAQNWRELIIERASLFLHEQSSNSIRHNVGWLEKNLEVQLIQSISLRRTLRGLNLSHTERRTAALTSGSSKTATLSITTNPDIWQVSDAVVKLLIDRPKTQTTMIFETMLQTSLLRLRSRGYNVDRILRKRQAEEARVAEQERQMQEEFRQRQDEERKRLAEEERNRPPQEKMSQAIAARQSTEQEYHDEPDSPQQPLMPGAFHDSPDRTQRPQRSAKSLFSSFTKSLGLDTTKPPAQQLQQLVSNESTQIPLAPPPYTPYDPQQPRGPGTSEPATHPDSVRQNLQRAITASRPYGSSTLFSRPETNHVKETSQYCDVRHGHNLTLLGTSVAGLKIYASNSTSSPLDPSFLTQNTPGLESFASLLLDLGTLFALPASTLHIYHDPLGSTIAFNRGGAIFANYRFFAQLHLNGMGNANVRAQAMVYWWVTLCHELAHNLVGDHSSAHSYYTEQFVALYFPAVAGAVVGLAGGGADGTGEGGQRRIEGRVQPQFERQFM